MIAIARDSRGVLQKDLAYRLGISQGMMSKIENHEALLNDILLKKLAKVLNYKENFFFNKGEYQSTFLSYRRRRKVSPRILIPIDASINVVRISIDRILRELSSSPFLSILNQEDIVTPEQAAQEVRRTWGLPHGPIKNIIWEIEKHGIISIQFDFNTERVDSRTVFGNNNIPIIISNSSLMGDRQRFSIAYELGHIVLHALNPQVARRNFTREANLFASEFLMPTEQIREDLDSDITIVRLGELKLKWKVSMQALLYRANDLKIISDNQKRYILSQFNNLGIRRREPKEFDVPVERNKLIYQMFDKYMKSRGINFEDTASELGLHEDDFLRLFSELKAL
jgi:Zn-dependent peptidase ImmA (M78 family)/DNA-binding XRE family transcriptional regulator